MSNALCGLVSCCGIVRTREGRWRDSATDTAHGGRAYSVQAEPHRQKAAQTERLRIGRTERHSERDGRQQVLRCRCVRARDTAVGGRTLQAKGVRRPRVQCHEERQRRAANWLSAKGRGRHGRGGMGRPAKVRQRRPSRRLVLLDLMDLLLPALAAPKVLPRERFPSHSEPVAAATRSSRLHRTTLQRAAITRRFFLARPSSAGWSQASRWSGRDTTAPSARSTSSGPVAARTSEQRRAVHVRSTPRTTTRPIDSPTADSRGERE